MPRRGSHSAPGPELLGVSTSHGPSRESYKSSRKASGPAAEAVLEYPAAIAFDTKGNLYIADWYNALIRKVAPGGKVSTVLSTVGSSI